MKHVWSSASFSPTTAGTSGVISSGTTLAAQINGKQRPGLGEKKNPLRFPVDHEDLLYVFYNPASIPSGGFEKGL